jgi:predicted phosphodiesterase
MKYTVAIVDDSLNDRIDHYKKVLDDSFEIKKTFAEPSEFENAVTNDELATVDVYIIDAILDTGNWREKNWGFTHVIETLMERLPRTIPVILVSQNWGKEQVTLEFTKQLHIAIQRNQDNHNASYIEIITWIAWSKFKEASETTKSMNPEDASESMQNLRRELSDALGSFYKPSAFTLKENEDIKILLLSDLQFGDPHTAATSSENNARKLVDYLKEIQVQPELVLLAGDISYSGCPLEFKMAENWLNNLFASIFLGPRPDPRQVSSCIMDRLILVPGNHDVNFRLLAGNQYDYAWEVDPDSGRKKGEGFTKREKDTASYQDYGLEPFRRFAYKMIGQREWRNPELLPEWIDYRFVRYGLRFFGFNTVSKLDMKEGKPSIAMNENESSKKAPEYFSIAISHHGVKPPDAKGESVDNLKNIKDAFFSNNIKLWIFGHYHHYHVGKIQDTPPKNDLVKTVSLPTLRINNDEYPRGFCILELERQQHKVIKASICHYYCPQGSGRFEVGGKEVIYQVEENPREV